MVREDLMYSLERGKCEAAGLWLEDELVGVSAWQFDSTSQTLRSIVLAVRYGRRGRGYGRQLKERLVEEARRAGAVAISSTVDWDNAAMLRLNRTMGASI